MLRCNDECRVSRMFGRQLATQDRVHVISFPTIQVQSPARRDLCWYVLPWRVHKCGITGTMPEMIKSILIARKEDWHWSSHYLHTHQRDQVTSHENEHAHRPRMGKVDERCGEDLADSLLRHRLGWNVAALWLVAFVVPICSLARCHRREGWKVEHWHSAEWSRHISAPSHLAPLSSSWNAGNPKA